MGGGGSRLLPVNNTMIPNTPTIEPSPMIIFLSGVNVKPLLELSALSESKKEIALSTAEQIEMKNKAMDKWQPGILIRNLDQKQY